jgi:hypothetical protein
MPNNFAHLGGLNAYEILGIQPTATTEEIEAAYRAAIKRQHSDAGGVTRLAQLVNDARNALVKDRAGYDAWLRNTAQPRVAEHEPSRDEPVDDVWDPWAAADSEPTAPSPPPQDQPPPQNYPPPQNHSDPRDQPWTTTYPDGRQTAPSTEEGRTQTQAEAPPSSGLLAVVASVLFGPLGLWLGVRSYRHGRSASAVVAIVIGGMSVLSLAAVAIAIPLGVFKEWPTSTSSPNPPVMKQGQVVVKPGTRIALDEEGTSFTPSGDHASLVGTKSGIRFEDGTSHVRIAQRAPERYDSCSALTYPEPTDKPIPWNQLTIGSTLCVRTTELETTKSLITVVDRSGRSATLQIITWND